MSRFPFTDSRGHLTQLSCVCVLGLHVALGMQEASINIPHFRDSRAELRLSPLAVSLNLWLKGLLLWKLSKTTQDGLPSWALWGRIHVRSPLWLGGENPFILDMEDGHISLPFLYIQSECHTLCCAHGTWQVNRTYRTSPLCAHIQGKDKDQVDTHELVLHNEIYNKKTKGPGGCGGVCFRLSGQRRAFWGRDLWAERWRMKRNHHPKSNKGGTFQRKPKCPEGQDTGVCSQKSRTAPVGEPRVTEELWWEVSLTMGYCYKGR